MLTTMGVDPLTATLVTTLVPDLLHAFLGTGATTAAPSAAQVQAALDAQRAAAAAKTRTYLIAGGIALVAGVGLVLLLRKSS
jgi:hypothetical protein